MAQVTAFARNRETERTDAANPGPQGPALAPAAHPIATQEVAPAALEVPSGAQEQAEPKPNGKRKKAKAFGLVLLVGLGSCIAWYPLSDHHAPYAGAHRSLPTSRKSRRGCPDP